MKKIKTSIVLGLGFGDEGKGLMTDYLCSPFIAHENRSLVVRFSGGHQAGHTVKHGDKRHVFAQFGSGTFRGATTYWSKHCTFCPISFEAEYNALRSLRVNFISVYVDTLAQVTTPYDVFYNRAVEIARSRGTGAHGSCGVGFAATVERSQTCTFNFQDIFHHGVAELRMKAVEEYYDSMLTLATTDPTVALVYRELKYGGSEVIDKFFASLETTRAMVIPALESKIFAKEFTDHFDHIVFEGSQGIMLDMDFGFFPHVTRANTTSKNAMEFVSKYNLSSPTIYYMTRSYQNRHGNGPMTNEGIPLNVMDNIHETNIRNDWQGSLRKTVLDLDLIKYALRCDKNFSVDCNKNIVVTCLDQIDGKLKLTSRGELLEIDNPTELHTMLLSDGISKMYMSYSDDATGITTERREMRHA